MARLSGRRELILPGSLVDVWCDGDGRGEEDFYVIGQPGHDAAFTGRLICTHSPFARLTRPSVHRRRSRRAARPVAPLHCDCEPASRPPATAG